MKKKHFKEKQIVRVLKKATSVPTSGDNESARSLADYQAISFFR